MQAERVAVDVGLWDEGVELVRLDEAEVSAFAVAESGQVVEAEVDALDGVASPLARVVEVVVLQLLASTTNAPDEFDDGVIEVELDADLAGTGADGVELELVDELLEGAGGETIALLDVEVDVGGFDAGAEVVGGDLLTISGLYDHEVVGGHLDALLEVLELDVDLDTVELEGDEREGVSGGEGEPEGEWDVEASVLLGVRDELGDGPTLADHLFESLSGLSGELFPHVEEVVGEGVDDLASDDQARAANQELSDGVGPVGVISGETGASGSVVHDFEGLGGAGVGGQAVTAGVAGTSRREQAGGDAASRSANLSADPGKIDQHVHPVHQVSRAIQQHLRAASEAHLRLERLLDRL